MALEAVDATNRIRQNGDVLFFDKTRAASRTFDQNLKECQDMDGRLPKIKSKSEKEEIQEFVLSNLIPSNEDVWFWVGVVFKGNGEYRWIDDDSLLYFSPLPFYDQNCDSKTCCRLAFSVKKGQLVSHNCNSNFMARDLVRVIPLSENQNKKIHSLELAKKKA